MNRWGLVGIWMILILILSVGPAGSGVDPFWPYAVHFLEYAVLGAFLFRAITYTWDIAYRSSFILAAGIAFIYGTTMETLQLLLPYRSFSLEDMVVNLTGAAVALVLLRVKEKIQKGA